MTTPTPDPGVTIAARGQKRAAAVPAVTATPVAASARASVTPLDRLSASLPPPLRRVPLVALLGWAGLGAAAAVVLLSVAVRSAQAVEILEEEETVVAYPTLGGAAKTPASATPSSAPTAPAKPAAARATEAELAAAKAAGGDALAQLAQRFPEDPGVLRALFLAQAADKKSYSVALRTARRLFDALPEAGSDTDVRTALVAIANGPSDTAAVALDLMAGEMGPRGAELLFEVANGSVLLSKTKAAALLKDADVRAKAAPALLVAFDLSDARPCARKAFLGRAKSDGDARSLPFLKPLLTCGGGGGGGGLRNLFRGGGGGGECLRCFTPADKAEIQGAIDAIEARSGDGGAPAPK
jgi:hypothetical protein